MFVEPGRYTFEARGAATRLLPNLVSLAWVMVEHHGAGAGGEVAGGGVDILALDDDGRIRTDHQFIGVAQVQ